MLSTSLRTISGESPCSWNASRSILQVFRIWLPRVCGCLGILVCCFSIQMAETQEITDGSFCSSAGVSQFGDYSLRHTLGQALASDAATSGFQYTPVLLLSFSIQHIDGDLVASWNFSDVLEVLAVHLIEIIDGQRRVLETIETSGSSHFEHRVSDHPYSSVATYYLETLNRDGSSLSFGPFMLDRPAFELSITALPNPMRANGHLLVTVETPGKHTIKIFDLQGRLILIAFDEVLAAGVHQIPLDSELVPSGVYFYTIQGRGNQKTNKLVVLH